MWWESRHQQYVQYNAVEPYRPIYNTDENDLYGFIITNAEERFVSAKCLKVTSAAVWANVAEMIILDVTVELAFCFASLLLNLYAYMLPLLNQYQR